MQKEGMVLVAKMEVGFFVPESRTTLNAEKQELEDFTLAVASNQKTKEEITVFLRTNTQPL